MGKVQLIIDNEIADIFSENDLQGAISYSIGEINDVEKRGNSTSRTIKIPATSKNKRILGYPNDLTVSTFKGQKTTLTGTIREHGTDVLTGKVNLKTVQITGIDTYYEITIIGNSSEWVNTMTGADLIMSAPDVIDGYHYRSPENVATSWGGALAYCYGLINRGYAGGQVRISSIEDDGNGKALCIIDGTNEQLNLRVNIAAGDYVNGVQFDNSIMNKLHKVEAVYSDKILLTSQYLGSSSGVLRNTVSDIRVEDLSMLINVEKVFTKLFTLSGYRIVSDFISSNFFKSLFILPGTEKRKTEWIESYSVTAGLTAEFYDAIADNYTLIPFNSVTAGKTSIFNTGSSKFTAPFPMLVNVRARLNCKGTEGFPMKILFFVGSTNTEGKTGKVTVTTELQEAEFSIIEQEAELRLNTGDYVRVFAYIPILEAEAAWFRVSQYDTEVVFTPMENMVNGTPIYPYEFLPDMKQIDFIKAIRHAFNLYFFTDVNMKTVYIEPRDTFYKRDKYVDLTEKLDVSKQITFEELGAEIQKRLTFRYKPDSSDFGIEKWENDTSLKYSSYTAELLNKFATDEEKAIENPMFAATLMDTYDSCGLTLSLLPKLWQTIPDKDTIPEKWIDHLPRLLFFAGMRDCKSGESWNFEGVAQTEIPMFCAYDPDSVNDNSLMFDPQPNIPDLYFKHYANYIRTINEGRKITAFFNLKATDIQGLTVPDNTGSIVKDYRALFYFRHRGEVIPCRLESINDYQAGKQQSTKMVLITDVDNISNIVSPFISSMVFTNDTISMGTAYANGTVVRYGTFWSDCRNGTNGNLISQSINYGIGAKKGGNYQIERTFLFFDTSNIPDAATIVEVYLDIYKLNGDPGQEIAVFAGTQGNIISHADYQKFGSVNFGESSPGNLGLRRIYLNASGIAHISKTGWTKFCLRERNFDVGNVAPVSNYTTFRTYLNNSPAVYLNKLTVKYTE